MGKANNIAVLTSITTWPKYIQLGLYNLKAYVQTDNRLNKNVRIDLDIVHPDKYIFYQESSWPFLDYNGLLSNAKRLLKNNPKLVGFSCFNWNIELMLKLCRLVKKLNPQIITVLGGPEVSVETENIMHKEKSIDLIVRDEGEATFSDLLKSIFLKDLPLSEVEGINYRKNGKIIKNASRKPLILETLPSPYLTNLINVNSNDDQLYTIETSRGCAFKCSYCSYSILNNKVMRLFPIDKVKKEFSMIFRNKIRSLWINDDNFNINPHRAVELLEHIKRRNKSTKLTTFINASMWKIDDKLIKLLKDTDFECIIGVQSINSKPLELVNRKNIINVMEDNLRRFDNHKIRYVLQFIAGLPGDSYSGLKNSIDWANQFEAREIQIFLLRLIRGTRIHIDANALGLVTNTRHFQYHTFITKTNDIDKKEMIKVKKIINSVEMLYNIGLMKNTIKYISKNYNLKLSEIAEEWGKVIKILINNRNFLIESQKFFIMHLISKYRIEMKTNEVKRLLSKDLESFLLSKMQANYFPHFQARKNTVSL